jgi:hypothetical protein
MALHVIGTRGFACTLRRFRSAVTVYQCKAVAISAEWSLKGSGSSASVGRRRPRRDPIRQGVSVAWVAIYFFGGLIMMCAPGVPGNISHGALSLALVDSPVDSGVAKGT